MQKKQAALGFIFVTLLIDVMGFGIIIPVMPELIENLGHVSVSDAAAISGWMLAAFGIMQFVFSPMVGNLSDSYGRRPILLLSLFGFFIDYLFLYFAPSIEWLFVGRVVAGIMGASFTTASAYIADITAPEKRAQSFGIIGVAFGIGFILGPVIGGAFSLLGPRAPFIAAAALTFLNWLYGYFILPESLPVERRRPFDWKRANPIGTLTFLLRYKVILGLVASIVLLYLASHAIQSIWNFYTEFKFGWDGWDVGLSLGFVGILIAVVQGGLIRFIIPKLGERRSVYIGVGLNALGLVLMAFATQGWMMYAFLVPYCLGGITGPALQGIMSKQVAPNEQGELQGSLTSLISITSIFGPIIMTNLFKYFSQPNPIGYFPGAAMVFAAVLMVIAAVMARFSLKKNLSTVVEGEIQQGAPMH